MGSAVADFAQARVRKLHARASSPPRAYVQGLPPAPERKACTNAWRLSNSTDALDTGTNRWLVRACDSRAQQVQLAASRRVQTALWWQQTALFRRNPAAKAQTISSSYESWLCTWRLRRFASLALKGASGFLCAPGSGARVPKTLLGAQIPVSYIVCYASHASVCGRAFWRLQHGQPTSVRATTLGSLGIRRSQNIGDEHCMPLKLRAFVLHAGRDVFAGYGHCRSQLSYAFSRDPSE
jgi:hypothetical protein